MAILINDTSPFVRYVATAGQTLFTVPFEFFDEADLVVELNGTELTYSVTPADATQYSVTGANQEGGGSITLGAPGASLNDVVLIYSDIAIERNANYPETGPMAIASLNQEQARHIAIMKQLKRDIDRAIKAALGANGINIDYDSLSDGEALIWDAVNETLIGAVIATSDNTYIIGGTDVAIADGGTGASTAPQARINLGLEIGVDVQAAGNYQAAGSYAAQAQTAEAIAGFIASPSDKSYTIALKMPHAGTITETVTKSASGTATATFKINSTALGGTANSVSSTEQSQAHSTSNAFAAGDDIVLTISANASCADLSFMIKYSRTLA